MRFVPRRVLLSVLAFTLFSLPASAKVVQRLVGDPADVTPALSGPAVLMEGGAADSVPAIQAMIDAVRGCTGCATTLDVVILDAYGTNDYPDFMPALNGVNSVQSFTTSRRDESYLPEIVDAVRNAEIVFFDGGDQCNYVTQFMGTPIDDAVKSVYARGGAVGGVSAGMAIMGGIVFDACSKSVTSAGALSNPYHGGITFTYGFFGFNDLTNAITDTHFSARDRMGRLMTYLARQIADGVTTSAVGIGGNEGSGILLGSNGVATVYGADAYFVLADHAPELCAPKKPLTYSNFKVWKVSPGGSFDLRNLPTTGFTSISVTGGVLSASPY